MFWRVSFLSFQLLLRSIILFRKEKCFLWLEFKQRRHCLRWLQFKLKSVYDRSIHFDLSRYCLLICPNIVLLLCTILKACTEMLKLFHNWTATASHLFLFIVPLIGSLFQKVEQKKDFQIMQLVQIINLKNDPSR